MNIRHNSEVIKKLCEHGHDLNETAADIIQDISKETYTDDIENDWDYEYDRD